MVLIKTLGHLWCRFCGCYTCRIRKGETVEMKLNLDGTTIALITKVQRTMYNVVAKQISDYRGSSGGKENCSFAWYAFYQEIQAIFIRLTLYSKNILYRIQYITQMQMGTFVMKWYAKLSFEECATYGMSQPFFHP